ncbi:unnamed protein product [Moneuplotes crassus]|uniref:EamA domain-containing protein n=1 Tax=Euplotes crassus TaxID=5936 RepID=A0AAD1XFB0_EUPCR|nr:unnamed protein product [Moneuplotes crassus]
MASVVRRSGAVKRVKSEDEEDCRKEENRKGEELVSAKIWVPVSLLVSILNAIAGICFSYVSKYKIKAGGMQGAGEFLGNSVCLIIISFQGRYLTPQETSQLSPQSRSPWLKWLYDIYYIRKRDIHGNLLHAQWEQGICMRRALITVVLVILTVLLNLAFVLSLYYATVGFFNSGIMCSLGVTRVIFVSIIFYFMFKQSLKWYEIAGIMILIISVVSILYSGEDKVVNEKQDTQAFFVVLACLSMIITMLFSTMRIAVCKYVSLEVPEINIPALYNFTMAIYAAGMIIYLIVLISQGFEFTLIEFSVGTLGGALYSVAGYLTTYVNVRGKAAIASAIIEGSTLFQTVFDLLLFGRYPNLAQYIGLLLGFGAVLFIILFNSLREK